ncbi:MAG: alpha/beta fold hydrolase [Chloroflexi bacterium]|nr:alpha/beta fold hydrolase [Chloroflexota bacterium]
MATTATDQFLQANGLKIRYRVWGDGTPVMLLHGAALGSSLDVWDRHLDALASRGLRVVVFDRPGFGRSDDAEDASPAFQRQFILSVMDALGIPSAGLVGHSQTGSFVVQLALVHPDRVSKGMVLGSGSLLPPLEGNAGGPAPGESGPADRPLTREDVRAVLEGQLYDHSLITPELVDVRYDMALGHPPRRDGAAPAPGGGATVPLWQRLGDVRVPLLMLYGRDDRGSVPERAAILRERYPHLDIRVLDRCKHLIQLDRSDAFVSAAGEFFVG